MPLQEMDVQEFVSNSKPINTINKTRWAVSVFNSWKNARGWEGELLTMSNENLNSALNFFILEVRNKSGKEYYPNTIYELIISIQHYLRANNRFVSFLDDTEFNTMREVLDAKMKSLSKQGIGLKRRQADIISIDQENIMWQKEILGSDSPKRLLDTLLYSIGLNFALRAAQEHRNLRVGEHSQLTIKTSPNNVRYLEYREDVSKCNPGGLNHRKVEPKVTRAYENLLQPERCIVKLFEKYMSLRYVIMK
jgi:hypothetical protein